MTPLTPPRSNPTERLALARLTTPSTPLAVPIAAHVIAAVTMGKVRRETVRELVKMARDERAA